MTTIGTLFSGFGGVDVGAMAAGLTPLWGIEYDDDIADVARRNLGDHVITADILDVDPAMLPAVDVLHASPPCPNFSVAKAGAEETKHDFAMARKVAEFIWIIQPSIFTMENVYGYRKSKSWDIIRETLNECGYWMDVAHVNAADFGVPQTRKRMIVRAVLNGWVPMLPPAERWVGWYEAIEDLIPTLPESKLAPWQLKRLPNELTTCLVTNQGDQPSGHNERGPKMILQEFPATPVLADSATRTRCILVDGKLNSNGETLTNVNGETPSFTVTASHNLRDVRGVLVETGNAGRDATNIDADMPSSTVTAWHGRRPSHAPCAVLVNESSTMEVREAQDPCASQVASSRTANQRAILVGGANTSDTQASPGVGISYDTEPCRLINSSNSLTNNRAILDNTRIVAMTPRCLARFQSFPDWYELPDKRTLAARGIGNAVPPLLYEKIIRQLVEYVFTEAA